MMTMVSLAIVLCVMRTLYCDTCKEAISDTGMAMIVAKRGSDDDPFKFRDFRVVHKNVDGRRCDPDDISGYLLSFELSEFDGEDGLSTFLSLISRGPLDTPRSKENPVDQFVDLARRLFVPHYEEARWNFRTQEAQETFAGSSEATPYTQRNLIRIAQFGGDN